MDLFEYLLFLALGIALGTILGLSGWLLVMKLSDHRSELEGWFKPK